MRLFWPRVAYAVHPFIAYADCWAQQPRPVFIEPQLTSRGSPLCTQSHEHPLNEPSGMLLHSASKVQARTSRVHPLLVELDERLSASLVTRQSQVSRSTS